VVARVTLGAARAADFAAYAGADVRGCLRIWTPESFWCPMSRACRRTLGR
jgi:hypothetical protein